MRDGGIAKFTWQKQSLSRLRRQLPLHKGATAAAGLLIGKSLFGTTRLAGGFRKNSSFVGVLYARRVQGGVATSERRRRDRVRLAAAA